MLPQLLLCGLFAPRETMATPLQWLADVLPLTYAVDGMQEVARSATVTGDLVLDATVVAGCILAALVTGAATLPRRTP